MKRIKAALSAVLLIAASGSVFAQDFGEQNAPGAGRRSGQQRRAFNPAEQDSQWEKAQTELRKKTPEKYAEIQKLAASNLNAAMRKMRELARQERISLPGGMPAGMRGPGGENGGEPGAGRMGPGGMNFGFSANNAKREQALDELKKANPQAYAEIEKLLDLSKAKQTELDSLKLDSERRIHALAKSTRIEVPDTMETFRLKLSCLREKYGSQTAEIFRSEDSAERSRKLSELAEKEGFGIDSSFLRMGMRRNGGEMPGGQPPESAGRQDGMALMRNLRKAFPEEMKKYDRLRTEDPAAARRLLDELRRRLNEKK